MFHQPESKVYEGCGNVCVCACIGDKCLIIRVFRLGKRKVRVNLVEMRGLKSARIPIVTIHKH